MRLHTQPAGGRMETLCSHCISERIMHPARRDLWEVTKVRVGDGEVVVEDLSSACKIPEQ